MKAKMPQRRNSLRWDFPSIVVVRMRSSQCAEQKFHTKWILNEIQFFNIKMRLSCDRCFLQWKLAPHSWFMRIHLWRAPLHFETECWKSVKARNRAEQFSKQFSIEWKLKAAMKQQNSCDYSILLFKSECVSVLRTFSSGRNRKSMWTMPDTDVAI